MGCVDQLCKATPVRLAWVFGRLRLRSRSKESWLRGGSPYLGGADATL
jgi:hypothetical protein